MTELVDCPTELLLGVFLLLDNIDDALHLARCNQQLHAVFESYRITILENIVRTSEIHTYDVMLCHFQDAFHHPSSQERCPGDDGRPAEVRRPSPAVFEQCLQEKSVSRQQVWDIVARWLGLRPLQDLYLAPAIRSRYARAMCMTRDIAPQEAKLFDIPRLTRGEGDQSGDDSNNCTTTFTSNERGRFYKALTAYWLAAQSLKLAESCHYRLQSTMNKVFERVDAMWRQRSDLQESLDVLEVFDFVYGFLCQQIPSMRIDTFTDWIDEDWLSVLEPLHGEWAFFLKNVWLALSPADILDLLCSASYPTSEAGTPVHTWSRERKKEYLRLRGFSYNRTSVAIRDVEETPDTWYSASHLEEACEIQLQHIFTTSAPKVSAAWEEYRTTHWRMGVRGQFGGGMVVGLVDFIGSAMHQTDRGCS